MSSLRTPDCLLLRVFCLRVLRSGMTKVLGLGVKVLGALEIVRNGNIWAWGEALQERAGSGSCGSMKHEKEVRAPSTELLFFRNLALNPKP